MSDQKKSPLEVAIEKATWSVQYHTDKLREETELLEALLLAQAVKQTDAK